MTRNLRADLRSIRVALALIATLAAILVFTAMRFQSSSAACEVHLPSSVRLDYLASEVSRDEFDRPTILAQNSGTRDGSIVLVGKSCSCLDVLLDRRSLAVGESFNVPAGESRTLSVPVARAQQRSRSHFLEFEACAESGKRTLHSVSMEVNVWPDMVVRPALLAQPRGSAYRATIAVDRYWRGDANDGDEFTLDIHSSELDVVVRSSNGESRPVPVADSLWRRTCACELLITDTRASSETLDMRQITVDSLDDGARVARGTLHVRVHDQRPIVGPELVHFGRVEQGGTCTRSIVLRSGNNAAFRVVDIQSNAQTVSAAFSGHDDARRLHAIGVTLAIPDDALEERIDGAVVIATDHPACPELQIPFVILVQGHLSEVARANSRE